MIKIVNKQKIIKNPSTIHFFNHELEPIKELLGSSGPDDSPIHLSYETNKIQDEYRSFKLKNYRKDNYIAFPTFNEITPIDFYTLCIAVNEGIDIFAKYQTKLNKLHIMYEDCKSEDVLNYLLEETSFDEIDIQKFVYYLYLFCYIFDYHYENISGMIGVVKSLRSDEDTFETTSNHTNFNNLKYTSKYENAGLVYLVDFSISLSTIARLKGYVEYSNIQEIYNCIKKDIDFSKHPSLEKILKSNEDNLKSSKSSKGTKGSNNSVEISNDDENKDKNKDKNIKNLLFSFFLDNHAALLFVLSHISYEMATFVESIKKQKINSDFIDYTSSRLVQRLDKKFEKIWRDL